MIVKNAEAINRMIVRLESILETDDTVSNLDRRWINEAIIDLGRVTGAEKISLDKSLQELGYGGQSKG